MKLCCSQECMDRITCTSVGMVALTVISVLFILIYELVISKFLLTMFGL
ncbi:MAG: hypothetical protein K8R13_05720 [Methanococcoides sp.]|nr:hypothetical protein [Methanococcoides sp.]